MPRPSPAGTFLSDPCSRTTRSPWRQGLVLRPDGATLEAAGLDIAPNMATYGRAEGLPRDSLLDQPVDVPVAAGALMMVRREDFLAYGGFYEPLFMYCEELDYCLRVPGRIVLHPASAVRHELRTCSGPAPLSRPSLPRVPQPPAKRRTASSRPYAGEVSARLRRVRRADCSAAAEPSIDTRRSSWLAGRCQADEPRASRAQQGRAEASGAAPRPAARGRLPVPSDRTALSPIAWLAVQALPRQSCSEALIPCTRDRERGDAHDRVRLHYLSVVEGERPVGMVDLRQAARQAVRRTGIWLPA